MKKPHVLNRAMFNRGGTSAYGRGITSNLVSDEQRQRFNYGGRVGLLNGGNWWDNIDTSDTRYGVKSIPAQFSIPSGRGYEQNWEGTSWDWPWVKDKYPEIETVEGVPGGGDPGMRTSQSSLLSKKLDKLYGDEDIIQQSKIVDDGTAEVMTDSDWMELLGPTEDQTKRTKGEAQLGLAAGALDVFSQPTIAKGMKAASPHLSKLAQTASADQKARDKAVLQGKVLSKVYTDRAKAKGEADINLTKFKLDAAKNAKTDVGRTYWERMAKTEGNKDKDIANNLRAASEGALDFKEVDEETFNLIVKDPEGSHGSQIVYEGDIMVVDKDKPMEQWSVKADLFSKI